jgi:septal ring factor EnvC (AmiA/AmiB activator)
MDLSGLSPALDKLVKKRKADNDAHEDAIDKVTRKRQALEKSTENLNDEVEKLCSKLQSDLDIASTKINKNEESILRVDATTARLERELEEGNQEKKLLNEEKKAAINQKTQLTNQLQAVIKMHVKGKSYFTLLIIVLLAPDSIHYCNFLPHYRCYRYHYIIML